MKRAPTTIALALTWDGARWPVKSLPPKARAFLAQGGAVKPPSARKLASLFADKAVREIRICWVPRLKGGDDTLCVPFASPDGKRSLFPMAKAVSLGDVLGMVYRHR